MQRRRLRISGTVQGVGFRPFVWRLANALGVSGLIANDDAGVWCEIQGTDAEIDTIISRLRSDAPPLARIRDIDVTAIAVVESETGFHIAQSTLGDRTEPASVPPDVAPCPACLAEIDDPRNRRYRYAFTCCTDCGPRHTIVRELPYDRARTSMVDFDLCADCEAEYQDPSDRRHHAQALCCEGCGPDLYLTASNDTRILDGPVTTTAALIRDGAIVTVKGAGGYQLVCRADDERVVAELRDRKHREEKPFAILVATLAEAARLIELDPVSAAALQGPEAPIVLAPRRPDAPVAPSVAPDTHLLGVMLPATALHALLVGEVAPVPLVCTSGNRSDEPIVISDDRLKPDLGDIADAVLAHDRRIERRADDSVGQAVVGDFQLLRRARGYAPMPIRLNKTGPPVLGVGAELKNTVSLAVGAQAQVSVHIGDLSHFGAVTAFESVVADLLHMCGAPPELVVHDLHPEYVSTKFAEAADLAPTLAVQHHHAHLASVLVDNDRSGPAIGITFDGLGMGADATFWGGEFLVGDVYDYVRAAHLAPVPMPGATAAIREPWRMAVSHLVAAFGEELPDTALVERHQADLAMVLDLCDTRQSPITSAVGRLFDSVGALCGLGDSVSYEAQAAMRLEQTVSDTGPRYEVDIIDRRPQVVAVAPLIAAIVNDIRHGVDIGSIAGGLHRWVADMIVTVTERLAAETGVRVVALTGGVFQNRCLVELVVPMLVNAGFEVLRHRRIPPNDGGISLGQVAVGRARLH